MKVSVRELEVRAQSYIDRRMISIILVDPFKEENLRYELDSLLAFIITYIDPQGDERG